ncbi:sex peptide receptor-related protein 2-like [Planococcus citri]|uniref:sex peptide receptor-related protein 2-like n=1 Tax=Planococcus citri TaxID=170843 RepID=UPI0031FA33A1
MNQGMKPNCSAIELYYFDFSDQQICGYSNIFFCVIGTFFNVLVILVYTQKHMISPMNTMFTHVAIVDTLGMISWLPHTWHHLIRSNLYSVKEHRTKLWETISRDYLHVTSVFIFTSMMLALAMALWRYIAILHPLKERSWCNMKSTRIAIFVCYLVGFLITLPSYLTTGVVGVYKVLDNDGFMATSCNGGNRTLVYGNTITLRGFWYQVDFLFYGLIVKTAPSVFLTFMIYRIIAALHRAKKCHRDMTESSTRSSSGLNPQQSERERQTNRITTILLILLTLFIIGELPHGIGCSLVVILGNKFLVKYYYPSAQVFNSIRIFCTSIHFLVYYSLSEQFRITLKTLFKRKISPDYRTSLSGMSSNTVLTSS